MADIAVTLKPEEINQALADAIVRSTLGTTIKKMVDEYVVSIGRNSYDNPVKKFVEEHVKATVAKLVEEHRPLLREQVRQQITGEVVEKLVTVAVDKFLKSLY